MGKLVVAGGVRRRDTSLGSPFHLWGLVSLGGFLLNSSFNVTVHLSCRPGRQAHPILTISSLLLPTAFPRWPSRGLLGPGDTHSPTPPMLAPSPRGPDCLMWSGGSCGEGGILRQLHPAGRRAAWRPQERHLGRRPAPRPLPVQLLWLEAALTVVLRAHPTQPER